MRNHVVLCVGTQPNRRRLLPLAPSLPWLFFAMKRLACPRTPTGGKQCAGALHVMRAVAHAEQEKKNLAQASQGRNDADSYRRALVSGHGLRVWASFATFAERGPDCDLPGLRSDGWYARILREQIPGLWVEGRGGEGVRPPYADTQRLCSDRPGIASAAFANLVTRAAEDSHWPFSGAGSPGRSRRGVVGAGLPRRN